MFEVGGDLFGSGPGSVRAALLTKAASASSPLLASLEKLMGSVTSVIDDFVLDMSWESVLLILIRKRGREDVS